MKKHLYILISLFLYGHSYATIINIPADQPTIQAGINVSVNGDTVLVQPGTYLENINYNGNNITVASLFLTTQDTNYISQTILNGGWGLSTVTFSNGEDTTALFCGFAITNGTSWDGGGISCYSSNPSLENLMITNNFGFLWGGGIYLNNSSPALNDLLISDNDVWNGSTQYTYGGGIACFNSSHPILHNVTISNNSSILGGGIYCEDSDAILYNVTISNNFANSRGGGMYCENSDAILYNVTISNNFANNLGGGIYCTYSNTIMQNVTIENNSSYSGGGIYFVNSSPQLQDVYISNNTNIYYGNGGGIYCSNSNPGLQDVTLLNNSAGSGGGLYCNDGSNPVLQNVTIFFNSAISGGGLYCNSSSPIFDSINRSNIYFNSAFLGNDLYSDTLMEVVVDTFTVLYPTGYHACPPENFSFDILNGKVEQVDADLYVSPDGDNANSGLTANDPIKNIYVAFSKILADSLNPHTIHLLEGTYSPSTNEELFPINIPDYISLSGESESSTALDAEGQSGVLRIDDVVNTYISDLTVTGGNSNGISITNCNPDIQNVTITNNTGYGIYCSNSYPGIENCQIVGNAASGLYCDNAGPELFDVIISNNSSSSKGGGLYCSGGSNPVLQRVTISNNSAYSDGGGIYCTSSDLVFDSIDRCNIFLNSAFRGNDLYAEEFLEIIVDTFTVLCPTEFHTNPFENFSFDILNGKIEQVDADLYVSPGGDNSNSGLTVNDPLKTIRFAFSKIKTNSVDQNTIFLLEGTYSSSSNGEAFPLYMPDYYILSGESDSAVILDAEMQSNVLTFDYNAGTTVSGLTIKGGSAEKGGGIYCHYSDPSLQYLTISENTAQYGAGICCEFALPQLQNVAILNNTTPGNGGGIYCANSNPVLLYVTLSENSANYGGAICCSNSSIVVQNASIFNNSASLGGAIACVANSSPELINSTITSNVASGHGGGIYCEGSFPYLQDLIITNNSASGGGSQGGGIYFINSEPVSVGLNIMDNSASSDGGGIYCNNSDMELLDAIITNNSALSGGGLFCTDSDPYLKDVYITNNTASGNESQGGGMYCTNSFPVFDSINRCNIYLNDAARGRDLYSDSYLQVIVDTFTVLIPSRIYTFPLTNYNFDILHGKINQFDNDLFVSPNGNNGNSGLTVDDPLKTIHYAFTIIAADSLHQNTINLLEGTYGQSTNGEIFPLEIIDYVNITGVSESDAILDGEGLFEVIRLYFNTGAKIADLTITNGSGRGIDCYFSNPVLENVTLSNNSGGGISCNNSSPDLLNVIITNNSGGGIYCVDNSSPYLENVFVTDNSTSGWGGGIYCNSYSNPVLKNVQITGNTANDNGGGIACYVDCFPILINVTLTNNSANDVGGAIYSYASSTPSIANSILWNNAPQEIFANNIELLYSDIQGGWEGEGNIDENPLFTASGNYPYELSDESPCVNTGTPDTTGLNLPEFDLAGNPRIFGGRIDMGTYENQNVSVFVTQHLLTDKFEFHSSPNPFSDELTITYNLPESAYTKIDIYNSTGKKVKELFNNLLSEGNHVYNWKAKYLPPGIYFIWLQIGNEIMIMKIIKL